MTATANPPRRGSLLLVEDDEGDALMFDRAVRSYGLFHDFSRAADAETGLHHLRAALARGQPYDLVLLDINLPRMNGFELLTALRSDPGLRRTPVVMFTASSRAEDVRRAYELGANHYLVKPLGIDAYKTLVRRMQEYWFSTGELPPVAGGLPRPVDVRQSSLNVVGPRA